MGGQQGRRTGLDQVLKVGQLAERTGLTVRTLHHYDEIGLLSPSRRTSAGHRLYGESEVRRLQRIASLKHVGLSLEEIRDCLDRPEYSLEHALSLQVRRIDEEIARRRRLRDLVADLLDELASGESVPMDRLARTIEMTVTFERYYTPRQLDELAERRRVVGDERIREVQDEWRELLEKFGEAMEQGLDPASATVASLARRSAALVDEFTGGDPGVLESLSTMYRREGGAELLERHDMPMPPGLWEYMGEARKALQSSGNSVESEGKAPKDD